MYYRWPYYSGSLFRNFDNLRDHMDYLIGSDAERKTENYPPVNIWRDGDKLMITAELPGVKADELDVSVNGNVLKIQGKPEKEDESRDYYRRERKMTGFQRSIELPYRVDPEKIEAHLEKGILAVALPRAEADKSRKISIKAE